MCINVKGNNISAPIVVISGAKISNNNAKTFVVIYALLDNGAKISTNHVEITLA